MLSSVTFLNINISHVGEEAFQILGKLPSLLALRIWTKGVAPNEKLIIRNRGFLYLKQFMFYSWSVHRIHCGIAWNRSSSQSALLPLAVAHSGGSHRPTTTPAEGTTGLRATPEGILRPSPFSCRHPRRSPSSYLTIRAGGFGGLGFDEESPSKEWGKEVRRK